MNNQVSKYGLDIFIKGELIDLCLPNEEFALKSSWYRWFNNTKTTRFLEQGIFPNTPEMQLEFFNSLKNQNRLSLIISDRKNYLGTISLSSINLYKRTAEIALLFGEDSKEDNSDLFALESMALLTTHGFEKIGLKRISAGQHIKLIKWQRKLELLGYRLDGIRKLGFLKANEEADGVSISIVYSDYNKILINRQKLWDNAQEMRRRISNMPNIAFVTKMQEFLDIQGDDYYNRVFNL